jgi:type IV pilus assembly protein PilQ
MRERSLGLVLLLAALAIGLGSIGSALAQEAPPAIETTVAAIRPQYLPPAELCHLLCVEEDGRYGILRLGPPQQRRAVEVRRNESANLLVLSGAPGDVAAAAELIRQMDVPPRQIEIDVRLVDVNRSMARDLGIDWEQVVNEAAPAASWEHDEQSTDQRYGTFRDDTQESERRETRKTLARQFHATSSLDLRRVISFLDESGAAEVRNAPRILTLNNRRATILDGQRVTYVARYASYSNLYQTDSLDAGVRLSVVPSLGESGYLTLEVEAELTGLRGDISGSPVKDGQIIENTVVVKSGETVLLGGLTRTTRSVAHRRFPILGWILPFLFSREIHSEVTTESYVLLTPRVVDLQSEVNPALRERIEGAPGTLDPVAGEKR